MRYVKTIGTVPTISIYRIPYVVSFSPYSDSNSTGYNLFTSILCLYWLMVVTTTGMAVCVCERCSDLILFPELWWDMIVLQSFYSLHFMVDGNYFKDFLYMCKFNFVERKCLKCEHEKYVPACIAA